MGDHSESRNFFFFFTPPPQKNLGFFSKIFSIFFFNIIVFLMGRFTSHNLLEHWVARAPQTPPVYSSGNIKAAISRKLIIFRLWSINEKCFKTPPKPIRNKKTKKKIEKKIS